MVVTLKTSEPPPRQRNRLRLAEDVADANAYVTEKEAAEWLYASNSRYASPLFFIKRRKKDGKRRSVIDFRAVNLLTVMDTFTSPTVMDVLLMLRDKPVKSCVDLTSAYNQLRLAAASEAFAAIVTPRGIFNSRVACLGIAAFAQRAGSFASRCTSSRTMSSGSVDLE